MKKGVIAASLGVVVLLFLTSFTPIATTTTIDGNISNVGDKTYPDRTSYKLTYDFMFAEPKLKEKKVDDRSFVTLSQLGTVLTGKNAGSPVFTARPVRLLLPERTKLHDIQIEGKLSKINTNDIDLHKTPIMPYQRPVPIGEKPSKFFIDEKAYQLDKVIPGKTFGEYSVNYCRGYAILNINLYPIQYNPGRGELSYYKDIKLILNLEKTDSINQFYRNNFEDKRWVESLVDNPETISTYGSKSSSTYDGGLCSPDDNNGLGYDYVIITRAALFDFSGTTYNWDDFIAKKKADGLETTKVKVEDILNCPDYWNSDPLFNDTPARIREFCKDAYLDWGTDYILIAGDQDGPAKVQRRIMHYGSEESPYAEDVESDIYWTHIDNTFNGDHDEQWGERDDGGFDAYSELYSGNLPCDTKYDISNWITKAFYYEDNLDPDYLDNAAFYGGNTGWEIEGDEIIEWSSIQGADNWFGPGVSYYNWTYPTWLGFQYGFETWNQQNPSQAFDLSVRWTAEPPDPGWQGGDGPSAKAGLRDAINNNQVTLLSGVAHANPYLSLDVSSSKWISDYHNTKPFFIHDFGCHCGDMDGADDGVLDAMLLHSDQHLAFACVYNTGYGWGEWNTTNSSSSLQQKCFWDYLFDKKNNSGSTLNWQLGKAQEWARDMLAPTINWEPVYDVWRGIVECCLLFGDPAQTIKPPTQPDHNIGVESIDVKNHVKPDDPVSINVHVFNEGVNNEENVVVKLFMDDVEIDSKVISYIESESIESVLFSWMPSNAGEYEIKIKVSMFNPESIYWDNEKTDLVKVGILNINTGKLFDTIQEAINDPDITTGDVILIPSGTYHEHLIVDKSITLMGENKENTILESSRNADAVLHIKDTNLLVVRDLTIQNGKCGILIESSSDVTITDNIICNIKDADSPKNAAGIYLKSSDNIKILNNEIFWNVWGILLTDDSSGTAISNNYIYDNMLVGGYQSEKTLNNRELSGKTNDGKDVRSLSSNDGNEKYMQSQGNKIKPLIFGGGIKLDKTHDAFICYNEIISNHYGIIATVDSTSNNIYNNNFNNTYNAFDRGTNSWDKGYLYGPSPNGGNWWSDYSGHDEFSGPEQNEAGSDGIGDIPYYLPKSNSVDHYPLIEPWNGPLPGKIFVDDDNTNGPWDGTPDHPFNTINEAVNSANPGDKIYVNSGAYDEDIFIDKTLDLIGELPESTYIYGKIDVEIPWIDVAGPMNITGFTIQSGGLMTIGVSINSFYVNVIDNIVAGSGTGVMIKGSLNKVASNVFTNCGMGMHISGDFNEIRENKITGGTAGLWIIEGNGNVITQNTITSGMFGVYLYASNNEIYCNDIDGNGWYGLYLYSSIGNKIYENNVTNTKSMYGVYSSTTSSNNIFYHNNFINNEEGNAYDYGFNLWDYNGEGNYWDDWSGIGAYIIPPGNNKDNHPLSHPWQ